MPRSAEAQELSLGVVAHSGKLNERRLPIHPAHLERISRRLRERMYFEHGYGERFGVTEGELAELVGGIWTREQLLAGCDVILLPKVQSADLAEMLVGQTVWGWPHCVQDTELTQIAIDRRLTLIAFEAMNHWQADGGFGLHVFHKNNELAGYCSVLHAMQLAGITGSYGRRLRATVIGFGATARGAVTALNAHGVDDVRVLTNRDVAAVGSPIHSTQIVQMGHDANAPELTWADTPDGPIPVATFLADCDIVVNCVLQDPDAPLIFVTEGDLPAFASGTLLVDVACDEGMGFSWARPTSFTDPGPRGRKRDLLLRRRPQPVLPVELRDLGDKRSPPAAPGDRPAGPGCVGAEHHHRPRHRDSRRRGAESRHPVLPAPRRGLSARSQTSSVDAGARVDLISRRCASRPRRRRSSVTA
jgi:alanine dehydrogenase